MSNQCSFNESSDPANLSNSQRGHLAELAFMRKAAGLGLSVAKPWNADERYDFIVRVETVCWRVQVKSVKAKSSGKRHHRVALVGGRRANLHSKPYSAAEIDFLVAYLFSENVWYVFPAAVIEKRKSICVSPGSKRSKFEQYREAWRLMKPRPASADAKSVPEMMTEP